MRSQTSTGTGACSAPTAPRSTAGPSTSPNRWTSACAQILEPIGLWEQVRSVDPAKLNRLIESRTLPPDVEDRLLASRAEVRTQHALFLKERERSRR